MASDGSLIFDTAIDQKGFNADVKKIANGVKSISGKLGGLKESLQKAFSGGTRSMDAYTKKADALRSKIEETEKQLEKIGSKQIKTQYFEELEKDIKKTRNELAKLEERREEQKALNVSEFSKTWERLSNKIAKVKELLGSLETERAQMMTQGLATVSGTDTQEYKNLSQQLEQQKQEYAEAEEAAKKYGETGTSVAQRLKAAFGNALKKALSGVGNAVKKLGSALASKLATGAKNAAKWMLGLKKSSSGLGDNVAGLLKKFTSLGSLLKRMLTRRFLLSVVNGAKEGLQNLAQASPAANAAMSSLFSSLTQLKNSFAAAFAPILTAVLPILKTLIGWLTAAANAVAQFFSALTGKGTFSKAVAVQEDYAASLGDTAKAAKEAKKELLGFDKITKLSDDSDSGGSGGGGVSPSQMFEETAVSNSIAEFVQALKDAWNAEDFTAVGQIIGNKINEMVEKIDELVKWENVGDKITTWVTNLSEVFNSLITTIKWENIGKTIGDGLNTITYSIETFLDKFDLDKFGTALAGIVNGLNGSVDWEAVGRTFSKGLNEIAGAVNNFADNTNWKEIGSNFAKTLNSAFSEIDPEALGKALSAKFKIVLETAAGFVKDFKWGEAGVKIGETINAWFNNINWEEAGKTLTTGLAGAFDTLAKALETIDWQGLAQKVVSFIQGTDWSEVVKSIFTAIANGLAGITEFIGTLIGEAFIAAKDYFGPFIDEAGGNVIKGLWEGIKAAFGNAWQWIKDNIFQPFIDAFKKLFGINSPSTVMAEMGGYLIDGLKNGLSGIWDKVKEKFSEWWNAVKDWFTEKFENFKNLGAKVVNNIKSGIGNIWGTIKEKFTAFWDSLKEWFSGKWETLKSYGTKIISNLKSGIGNIWKTIKEKFSAFWSSTSEWFKGKWDKFKNFGSTIVDKIKAGIGDIWAKLKEKFANLWNNIKNFWSCKEIVNSTVSVKTHTSSSGREHGGSGGGLQTGGVVYRPTRALIGENGPEAVIPLKNNTQWLDTVSKYVVNHIPHYATGNVIPANFGKYFAILGDNKKEPEVVSPVSTMKQAVLEALRESGILGGAAGDQSIALNINLDGNTIYNDVVRINRQRMRAGGVNPLGV